MSFLGSGRREAEDEDHTTCSIPALPYLGIKESDDQPAIPPIAPDVGTMTQMPCFSLDTPESMTRRGAFVIVDLPSVNAILAETLPNYHDDIPVANRGVVPLYNVRGGAPGGHGHNVYTVADQFRLLGDIWSVGGSRADCTLTYTNFGSTLVSNIFEKTVLVEPVRETFATAAGAAFRRPVLRPMPGGAAGVPPPPPPPFAHGDPANWLMQVNKSHPKVDQIGVPIFARPILCMPSFLKNGTVDADVCRAEWATLSTVGGWNAAYARARAGDYFAIPRLQWIFSCATYKYEPPKDWEYDGIKVPGSRVGPATLYATVLESQSRARTKVSKRMQRANDPKMHAYLHPEGVAKRHSEFDLSEVQVIAVLMQMSGGNAVSPF